MIWSNNVVNKFKEEFYTGMVTQDMIPNRKIAVDITIDGEKIEIWGWEVTFEGKQKLFLPDNLEEQNTLDMLPIRITETEEFSFRKEVYLLVRGFQEFRINPQKQLSIRKIVDLFSKVRHSEPEEYKLMVMLGIASYLLPMNWRISSVAGFGKNCFFDNLKRICQDVQCYQPKSAPKLKKECDGRRLVVANEFMELKQSEKEALEDFFRYVGDNNPELENNSLASATYGTKSKYSTDNLSVGVIYNLIEYYISDKSKNSREQEYFDFLYTKATNQRFLPMLFDKGELDASQFKTYEPQEEYNKYKKYYLAVVKSLLWHEKNFNKSLEGKDWELGQQHIIGSQHNRLNKHYQTFLEFIKSYSETEEEYNYWANKVWDKYLGYLNQLKTEFIESMRIKDTNYAETIQTLPEDKKSSESSSQQGANRNKDKVSVKKTLESISVTEDSDILDLTEDF